MEGMAEARNENGSPRTVKAADTACEIIDALRELDGAGVTELADHLDLSKGAVHTYLTTLRRQELVRKDDGEYRLGMRFLGLGQYVRSQVPVYGGAVRELEKLSEQTSARSQLVVEDHGMAVALHIEGEDAIAAATTVGDREYLHCIASGKAILASLPDARIEEIIDHRGLPERTENTITSRDELFDELETVREEGVAFNDEEKIRGLRAVGASIEDPDGRTLGAISVSGTPGRFRDGKFYSDLPSLVKDTANVIEFNNRVQD